MSQDLGQFQIRTTLVDGREVYTINIPGSAVHVGAPTSEETVAMAEAVVQRWSVPWHQIPPQSALQAGQALPASGETGQAAPRAQVANLGDA
jgi:hypothetical protein